MSELKITEKGGIHYLKGPLDEQARLGVLMGAPQPLRLNLAGLISANSLGIKIFVNFMLDLRNAEIEFHDCSIVAMEIFNTFPAALGEPPRKERLKSFQAPFECPDCGHEWTVKSVIKDHARRELTGLKPTPCPKCHAESGPSDYLDDLLLFL